ncbi:lachesin-like [Macrobrachium rosenbergii]|uniref:lachesin-like n=1 Tax=Macrobrachium rosenbergii TaxID=79674 RepID=UPI0034D6BD5B
MSGPSAESVTAPVFLTIVLGISSCYSNIITYPPARINEVASDEMEPEFGGAIKNVTVPLGREAVLSCVVDNLGEYKVGWMQADTQTILSLHKKVVTHNTRVSVTHDEPRTWNLHIRMVKEADRGCYMCQINTALMKKTLGCIDVHVPPNIIDEQTSGDVTVPDGESVTLTCTANGYPKPRIVWKREGGEKIILKPAKRERTKVETVEGPYLNLTRVNRKQMGAYQCIAQNEVPPAVMKRIMVNVAFAPSIQVRNQLVGSPLNSDLSLSCEVEAHPKPITFWKKNNNEIMIIDGPKYKVREKTHSYHTNMTLIIRDLKKEDIGTYTCVARNSISTAEEQIRTYEIKLPTPSRPTTESGPRGGGDTFAKALDHGAQSSGLHKTQVDESYTFESPVDTSHNPYLKGKRKDFQYNLEGSGTPHQNPHRPNEVSGGTSNLLRTLSSSCSSSSVLPLVLLFAHVF